MTMPSLMNCQHQADGICLKCVTVLISAEREACAKILEIRDSELLLMAGEMTPQELRTVKAVLNQRARAIRAR